MKFLLTVCLIVFTVSGFAQTTVKVQWVQHMPAGNSDTIFYSSKKKLAWPDFKGTADTKSDAIAITASGFGFISGVKYNNGKVNIDISVYCYFEKNNSWVKSGKESDYALNHEQHHFDITYIATCLFLQKLKTAVFTWQNYNDVLNRIYTESSKQLEKMQNEYDGQTRNGQLERAQAAWNTKIEKQLTALSTN
jgi:hypothetical protein